MSRRKSSQFAISLFSFQDIITSVSGVLILVVLLLILELTQRLSSSPMNKAYRDSASEIRQAIQRVNVEANSISALLEHSEQIIRRATENPQGELEDRISSESEAVGASQRQVHRLETIAGDVEKAEGELSVDRTRAKETEAKLLKIQSKISEFEQQLKSFSASEGTHYVAPDGVSEDLAWVCDCTGKGLKLYRMDNPADRHQLASAGKSAKSSEDLFAKLQSWVKANRLQARYILFVFRPSNPDFGRLIGLRGIELETQIGFDVVSEEHILTDRNGVPVP